MENTLEPARFARRDDVLPDLAEALVEPDGDFGVAALDAAGVAAGVSSGVASVVESPSFAFFFFTFFSFSDCNGKRYRKTVKIEKCTKQFGRHAIRSQRRANDRLGVDPCCLHCFGMVQVHFSKKYFGCWLIVRLTAIYSRSEWVRVSEAAQLNANRQYTQFGSML